MGFNKGLKMEELVIKQLKTSHPECLPINIFGPADGHRKCPNVRAKDDPFKTITDCVEYIQSKE